MASVSLGVQCPFYQRHDKEVITCEGITDLCTLKLVFNNEYRKKQQMEIFCCDHYKNCEIYRMLKREKYGVE